MSICSIRFYYRLVVWRGDCARPAHGATWAARLQSKLILSVASGERPHWEGKAGSSGSRTVNPVLHREWSVTTPSHHGSSLASAFHPLRTLPLWATS